jgi:hypothetical protein
MASTRDFHVGQKVLFGRTNGEKTLGEVVKVNPKKLKVKQLETRGQQRSHAVGTIWTVPPSLCTPADGSTPQQSKPPIQDLADRIRPKPDFDPGDRVEFDHDGTVIAGTVKRVNRKTTTVVPDHPTYPGQYWRVGHRALRASTTTAPAESPAAITGDKVAEAKAAWDRHAEAFRMRKEWLGELFTVRGTDYLIAGLNPRRPKYPVDAVRVKDGKKFKFTAQAISVAMLRKAC